MTTTIYLDVDGVINAVTKHVPTTTGWGEYARRKVNSFPIMYAPALVDALNELANRDDVTIKWLTTWERDAAEDLSPALGINGKEWPVLTGDQDAWHGEGWWKLEAIRADVEATAPDKFFWIDDDLAAELPALEWLATRPEGTGITPKMREGLTTEHVDQIKAAVVPVEVAA
ncbi:HAD domain-containing protein [Pseudarthrobacter sp. LMD1-1-1.1]|uniref:HAD domain-containing protein n=1 Tax=Pseudarthrobacter sp. LMD1-1-1.1 TaxID=3135242 RepID=UPI00341BEDE1